MNISKEKIKEYDSFVLLKEDFEKLEEISKSYGIKNKFDRSTFERVWSDMCFSISKEVSTLLCIYLSIVTEESLLDLFDWKISENIFTELQIKKSILISVKKQKKIQLNAEEIKAICIKIYEQYNDIDLFESFSELVSDKMLAELVSEYLPNPPKELNYLFIFSLKKRNLLKKTMKGLTSETKENYIFLVKSCLKIDDEDFVYLIYNLKLKKCLDTEWDSQELTNDYLSLLLLLSNKKNDGSLYNEIKYIVNNFTFWDLQQSTYRVYRDESKISEICAESLVEMICNSSGEDFKKVSYQMNILFSKSEDILINYMLPIVSKGGIERSKEILSVVEKNMDLYFNKIYKEMLELGEFFEISMQVIKINYLSKKITLLDFKENDYLLILKIYHCFDITDGDFICSLAFDMLQSTYDPKIILDLEKYLLTSIYDNFYYILEEKILVEGDNENQKLLNTLWDRKNIREKAIDTPDFKPSERNMNVYYEKEYEMYRKTREEAEKLSVFNNLFTRHSILYGNKIQYNIINEDGQLNREISEMSKISHSMKKPIRFINDPLFYSGEKQSILEGKIND
ncbi:hypothetical protein VBG40_03930 [Vagococcus fluvialis]|uniref:hypothetical protein n=1 Tax=Vagococcus fluvialis TaxID=2738 RepID=UPI0037A0F2AE